MLFSVPLIFLVKGKLCDYVFMRVIASGTMVFYFQMMVHLVKTLNIWYTHRNGSQRDKNECYIVSGESFSTVGKLLQILQGDELALAHLME